MAMEDGKTKALFSQVRFHIIGNEKLQPKEVNGVSIRTRISQLGRAADASKISDLLVENGAEEVSRSFTSDARKIDLEEITHIVTSTTDFPEYDAASEALKAIVKPDWVTSSIAKGRLANPRQYSPDPKLFFSGLIVCCADLPRGDSDAIIGGVLAAGGLHSSPVTKMVTHIVALTTENDKTQSALTKDLKCKIVLPHW